MINYKTFPIKNFYVTKYCKKIEKKQNLQYFMNYSPVTNKFLSEMDKKFLKNKLLLKNCDDFLNEESKENLIKSVKDNLSKSSNSLHKFTTNDNFQLDNIIVNYIRHITSILGEYYDYPIFTDFKIYGYFGVIYGKNFNQNLKNHVDDSDITINICLKNNTNTYLNFTGKRNIPLKLKENMMLIHKGNLPHEVIYSNHIDSEGIDSEGIDSERINLIIWLKKK